ncbi:MAG: M48 family metallopeptidase [Rickettsiales bacterium]
MSDITETRRTVGGAHLRLLSPEEAPGIYRAIEELSQKAGIDKFPVYIVDAANTANPYHRFSWNHNAAAINSRTGYHYVLGEGLIRSMGDTVDAQHISQELKAVLAHEMGHIKFKDLNPNKYRLIYSSPLLGVMAGFSAMFLYDMLKDQGKKYEAEGKTPEEVRAAQLKELESHTQKSDDDPVFIDAIKTFARYTIAGFLGGAAGLGVFRHLSHGKEYRCDRFSAELLGDGKPMANALQMLRKGFQKDPAWTADTQAAFKKAGEERDPYIKLLSKFTHPEQSERVKRAEAWTR